MTDRDLPAGESVAVGLGLRPIPRWVVIPPTDQPRWPDDPCLLPSAEDAVEMAAEMFEDGRIPDGTIIALDIDPDLALPVPAPGEFEWVRSTSQAFWTPDSQAKWHRLSRRRNRLGSGRLMTLCGDRVSSDWRGYICMIPPGPVCSICDSIRDRIGS